MSDSFAIRHDNRRWSFRGCCRGCIGDGRGVFLVVSPLPMSEMDFFSEIRDFCRVARGLRDRFVGVEMLLDASALFHKTKEIADSMSPKLEGQVAEVQHQQQNGHSVTHRQQVGSFLRKGEADSFTRRSGGDREMEGRGDQDGDDGDE